MDLLKQVIQLSQQQYNAMMADPNKELKDAAGVVLHTYDENIFYCIPQDLEVETADNITSIPNSTIDTIVP